MGLVRPSASPRGATARDASARDAAPTVAPDVHPAERPPSLDAADPAAARRAIAAARPGDEPALLARLAREDDAALREAILLGLARIGTEPAAEGLAALLSEPEPLLRNSALECLAAMPALASDKAEALGRSRDPDLRIAATTLAGELAESEGEAPAWLIDLLDRENEPAVGAAAAEALARIGDPRAAAPLRRMRARFAAEPFVSFAIDIALDAMRPS